VNRAFLRPLARTAVLLAAALVLAGALPAAAAGPDVRVKVAPRTVRTDERVTVTITVSGEGATSATLVGRPPRGKNLLPAGGASTSTQVSWVNGRFSAVKQFVLEYLPAGVGEGEVPSFEIDVDGKTVHTEPVPVRILEAPKAPGEARGGGAAPGGNDEVRVRTVVDRDRVWLGESILLEYRLESRVKIQGYDPDHLDPVPGFLVEDEPVSPRATRYTFRDSAGREWVGWVLFRRRLTPTRSGRLTIPPVPFTVGVVRRREDVFGMAFGGFAERVGLVAPAKTIEVKPLPEAGRPPDFSGAVGSFTLEARLDRARVAAGEAVQLEVTVRGEGNLSTASPPTVTLPPDVQAFDPVEKRQGPGFRTWDVPIVPRAPGRVQVGPVRFAYFDPAAGEYRVATVPPLPLEVTPGAAGGAATGGPAPVAARGGDRLRWLHVPDRPLRNLERPPWASPLLVVLAVLPPLLLLGATVLGPLVSRWAGSPAGRRARLRAAVARRLAAARKRAGAAPGEAAREVIEALHLWAGEVLGEPSRPLDRTRLFRGLAERTGREELARRFVETLEAAEAIRYAGVGEIGRVIDAAAEITREVPR